MWVAPDAGEDALRCTERMGTGTGRTGPAPGAKITKPLNCGGGHPGVRPCHTACHQRLCWPQGQARRHWVAWWHGQDPADIAELRRALGERLTTFRKAADVTQGQLAAAAYLDRTTVSHIEKGRARADEGFWQTADRLTEADGQLLTAYRQLEAAKRSTRQVAGRPNWQPYAPKLTASERCR